VTEQRSRAISMRRFETSPFSRYKKR